MQFSKTLINWYSEHKRDLPWRNTKNAYFIWLSEIILQQTQVKQGLPYYESFVKAFPTVFDLAKANEQTVLKLWQGLGYYSRARNLHKAAKYIVNELNGNFPETYQDLLKLKGVGDYTASAIASIAFGEKTAVVDGNVYRVLGRIFGIYTPINSTKGVKEFKLLASELIDKKQPALFNQAIMEFGSQQCKPKNPDCMQCPMQSICIAFAKKSVSELPVKLKNNKIRKRFFNYLVYIDDEKNTILEQRKEKGIWQNLYQFPLIESDTSLKPSVFKKLLHKKPYTNSGKFNFSLYNEVDIVHKLSHQHLHTKFWIINTNKLNKNKVPVSKLSTFPVPALISNFISNFWF